MMRGPEAVFCRGRGPVPACVPEHACFYNMSGPAPFGSADACADVIDGLNDGGRVEMRVAHGDARVVMAQNFLYFVKRVTGVDEEAGKSVAQIVQTHVSQPQSVSEGIPCIGEGAYVPLSFSVAGKNLRPAARQMIQHG